MAASSQSTASTSSGNVSAADFEALKQTLEDLKQSMHALQSGASAARSSIMDKPPQALASPYDKAAPVVQAFLHTSLKGGRCT